MQKISGIYIIYFNTDDYRYYIGQSIDVHTRVAKHINQLRKNIHTNKKLQTAYSKHGHNLLEYDILQVVEDTSILDSLEINWIQEFDSFKHGYNCHVGGSILVSGIDNPSTKYTPQMYVDILMLLAHTSLSAKQISDKLNITLGVVQSLAQLKAHIYLKDKYPKEYAIIESKYYTRCNKNTSIFEEILLTLYSNNSCVDTTSKITGAKVYTVYDILYGRTGKYLKEKYPIEYATVVLNRVPKSTSNRKEKYPRVIDPNGNILEVVTASHICKEHSLDPSSFSKLLNGKITQCKGWRLSSDSLL